MERNVYGVIKHNLPPFLRENIKNVSNQKEILIPQFAEKNNDVHVNMYDKKRENIGVAEARRITQTIMNVLDKYDYFSKEELGTIGNALLKDMQEQRTSSGKVDVSNLARIVTNFMGDKKLSRQDIVAIEKVVLDYRVQNKDEQDRFKQVLRTLVGYQKPKMQEDESNFELSQNESDSSSISKNKSESNSSSFTKSANDKDARFEKEETREENLSHGEYSDSAIKNDNLEKQLAESAKNKQLTKEIENIRNRYLIAKLQELELNCGTNGFGILQKEQQEKRLTELRKIINERVNEVDFAGKDQYQAFVQELESKIKDVIEPSLYANRKQLEKALGAYIGRAGSSELVQEVLVELKQNVWQDESVITHYMNVCEAQVDLQAKVAALEANHGKGAGVIQWRVDEYNQLREMSSQVRSMVMAVVNHKATVQKGLEEINAKLEKNDKLKLRKEDWSEMLDNNKEMNRCEKAMTDSLYDTLELEGIDIANWSNINSKHNVPPLKFRDKSNFQEHFQDILDKMKDQDLTNENVKKEFFNKAVRRMIAGKDKTVFMDWIDANMRNMYTRSGVQKTSANAILQLLKAEFTLLGENRKETKASVEELIKAGKLEKDQVQYLLDSGMIGDPSNEDENENGDSSSNGGGDGTKKDPKQEEKKEEDYTPFDWVTGEAKEISADQLKEIVKTYNKGKFSVMGALANAMEKSLVTLGLACNTKKSMRTPSIDKVVKQREKAEKKEAKLQAKLENDPVQNALKSQEDIKPTVPMRTFGGDSTLFVTIDGKNYTYEDISNIILERFKEEIALSTIDTEKIHYLLAALSQVSRYKEVEGDNKEGLTSKKEQFFRMVIQDRLDSNVGFDINWGSDENSWLVKQAKSYLEPIAKDITKYLKEDKTLDVQKIEEALKQMKKDEREPKKMEGELEQPLEQEK